MCSSVGYVQVHGSVDDLIKPGSAVAGAADSPHLWGIAECFATAAPSSSLRVWP